MGTRLAACSESEYTAAEKHALVSTSDGARGTTFGRFHDALNGVNDHSSGLPGRCVATRSTELEAEWPGPPTEGEPAELADKRGAILQKHREEVERAGGHGAEWGTVWAGAAVGLVTKVNPAAEVLDEVVREAEASLRRGAALVAGRPGDPTEEEMTPGSPQMLARAARVKEAYADRVLSPSAAAALMAGEGGFDKGRVAFVDVRTPDQFRSHEINGRAGVTLADESGSAVARVSLDDLVSGAEELPEEGIDAIVLCCSKGPKSAVAMGWLMDTKAVKEAYCVDGGITAWDAEERAVYVRWSSRGAANRP